MTNCQLVHVSTRSLSPKHSIHHIMPIKTGAGEAYDRITEDLLQKSGFINIVKVSSTLQGSIWRGCECVTKQRTVFKITNKYLHQNSMAVLNNTLHSASENILLEASILQHLSAQKNMPRSITKYYGFFENENDYFMAMEDGGDSLFDFVSKAHRLIMAGTIKMTEWIRVVQVIMKQLVEAVEFMHSLNICHFDVSLENILINEVNIRYKGDLTIEFMTDDLQIKLCDFGLAQAFPLQSQSCSSRRFVGKSGYKSPENVAARHSFDAKKNDVWCIGVCLFMLVFGGVMWSKATTDDPFFEYVINGSSGDLLTLLKKCDKSKYSEDAQLLDLLSAIFSVEDKRPHISDVRRHSWLSN